MPQLLQKFFIMNDIEKKGLEKKSIYWVGWVGRGACVVGYRRGFGCGLAETAAIKTAMAVKKFISRFCFFRVN